MLLFSSRVQLEPTPHQNILLSPTNDDNQCQQQLYHKYPEEPITLQEVTLLLHQVKIQTKNVQTAIDEALDLAVEICTDSAPALTTVKPALFPIDIWNFVSMEQRALVSVRWATFSQDRLIEIIPKLLKLDICLDHGDIAKKLFLAQALANIDVYFYPDEWDPPWFKGAEFRIETTDNIPIKSYTQRFSILKRAFLRARCNQLKRLGKLEDAQPEAYSSSVCLVP